jgi:hypothetical protein
VTETNGSPPETPPKNVTPKPAKKRSTGDKYFTKVKSRATATQANRTVLMCVGLGVGVILIARVAGTPGVKRLNDPGDLLKIGVGAGVTTVTLMVIAEVAPDVAIRMAWLIFIGALLTYGVDFAQAVRKGTLNPGVPLTPITLQPVEKVGKKLTP